MYFFRLNAQNTSLTFSTGTTYFYSFTFYEDHTIRMQPGFNAGFDFPLIGQWNIYSGIEAGLYKGGLQHKSGDITYNLDLNVWHISAPLYFRFSNENKWHPRFGLKMNIPLKFTYTYDIYDSGRLVYHNTDKPFENHYLDYLQLLLGVDVDLSRNWHLDFQTNIFLSANVSIGVRYIFPSN